MSTQDPAHWEAMYRERPPTAVSWYQREASISIEMLERLGVGPDDRIVDVGGGASVLVDHLLDAGFRRITVLDISARALAESRRRLGDRGGAVEWVCQDLLTWRPDERYDVWHDRALFHFMVAESDRDGYLATLRAALAPGGAAVVGTFAADGPERCSGLGVERYDPSRLAAAFGPDLEVLATGREVHRTPAGADQAFTWLGMRRPR
jgi:SAM-dependent methyltransferase